MGSSSRAPRLCARRNYVKPPKSPDGAVESTPSGRAAAAAAAESSMRPYAAHLAAGGAVLLAAGFLTGAILCSRPASAQPAVVTAAPATAAPATASAPVAASADLVEATKNVAHGERASLLGGDRRPNWAESRQRSIDVPADQLVGPVEPAKPAVDTLAAFRRKHVAGPLTIEAHCRWKELARTTTSCLLVLDGDTDLPSFVSVFIVKGSQPTDLEGLLRVVKESQDTAIERGKIARCRARIGAADVDGFALDYSLLGTTMRLRVFELATGRDRAAVMIRTYGATDPFGLTELLASIR